MKNKQHTKNEQRNKPRIQWRKLLLIILIALLVLLACRRCAATPIVMLTEPLKPSSTPFPTQAPPASVSSVGVMKSREQLIREYNITPPPPKMLLQPKLPPLPTRPPIQTIPISPTRQTTNIGGFSLTALICLLSLVGFPVPLY